MTKKMQTRVAERATLIARLKISGSEPVIENGKVVGHYALSFTNSGSQTVVFIPAGDVE